jgi:ribose 5-phosphate isomerase B
MRIVVGADHRGYVLKDALADHLRTGGHDVLDVGTNTDSSVDYPDIAADVAGRIRAGEADRGIVVCGLFSPSRSRTRRHERTLYGISYRR